MVDNILFPPLEFKEEPEHLTYPKPFCSIVVPCNLPILEVMELWNNTSVFCQGSNMSAIFVGVSGWHIA